jgi:hypothetical protein
MQKAHQFSLLDFTQTRKLCDESQQGVLWKRENDDGMLGCCCLLSAQTS